MSFEPGQIVSHYRLIERIGRGGMGIVWKAQDTVLGRPVAIKILAPHAARDEESRRRFLDEARIASSLNEAHIAQVYELAREGDLDFIVMEYVEGQPLTRLLAARPLPAEKVITLGLQAAQALARAHRSGLVHRDIKPGNILVTPEGDVKVVDFGLAKLFSRDDPSSTMEAPTLVGGAGPGPAPGREQAAESSALYGTPAYMSPEQSRGEALDPRSDIFSLGVVLYQMTTGDLPFRGDTLEEVLERVRRARPALPHDLAPNVPLELDRIIRKAMAPRPADRYQTMDDLAVDLMRLDREIESGSALSYHDLRVPPPPGRLPGIGRPVLAGASAAILLAVAAAIWIVGRPAGGLDAGLTILVLPLEVRGQAEGADYAGHAFAEAIAVNLAQLKELSIMPVPAAVRDSGAGRLDPARAAREAGANRVLSGTLTREGGKVRATLNLVDAVRNRITWGAQKEGDGDSLPELAAGFSRDIARELGATPPRLYEYFKYASGSHGMSGSPDLSEALGAVRRYDRDRALAATQGLIEAFPGDPDAHVLRCYALRMAFPESLPGSPERADFEACLSGIDRIDPMNPWDDVLRANVLVGDGRYAEANDQISAILVRTDLAPAARAYVFSLRGSARLGMGNKEGAREDLQTALALDPTNDTVLVVFSQVLRKQGQLEEALTRARQAVALNPTSPEGNSSVGDLLYQLARYEESLTPLALACAAEKSQTACAYRAVALQMAGREAEARAQAARASALPESVVGTYNLACYHALVGHRATALRLLRRSLALGPSDPQDIRDDSALASLHGDPEFERILEEAGRSAVR